MIPWVSLDSAAVPGATQELRLMRRGDEFSIRLGTTELMNSRQSGSEEALAVQTATRVRAQSAPDVLIGGLGMGFTLRAALAAFAPSARIVVAELVPAVILWAAGPLGHLFEGCLSEARVSLVEGDVRSTIASAKESFDAILLDVDNGPEGLTRESNDALYGARGIKKAFVALRSGGVLGVWSAGPDSRFSRRLADVGFNVEELRVRATGTKRGGHHVIWLATKP
jgi:spermidine synthase